MNDPQEITPDIWVRTYNWRRMPESSTGVRWALSVHGIGFTLSYEEMCALRRWFLGPELAEATAGPLAI